MSAGISANIGGVMRELGGRLRVFEGSANNSTSYTCECPFEPLFILIYSYNWDSGSGFGANGKIYFIYATAAENAGFNNSTYSYSDGVLTFKNACGFIAFG